MFGFDEYAVAAAITANIKMVNLSNFISSFITLALSLTSRCTFSETANRTLALSFGRTDHSNQGLVGLSSHQISKHGF